MLLEGQVAVQMRIYEAEVPFGGETALYIENHTNVPVTGGVFNVAVGTGTPLIGPYNPQSLFPGAARYLEIAVNGETLEPRQPVSAVPYAYQAEMANHASTASVATVADDAQLLEGMTLAEVTGAAQGAAAANALAIANETARAQAAEQANSTAIAGEATRALAAEQVNAAAIESEATRAQGAEEANSDAVTSEAARALAAEQANSAVSSSNLGLIDAIDERVTALESAPGGGRFIACADELTIEDTATGLLWERKTTDGSVHDVSNSYTWSSTGTAPDGAAYTQFLATLNAAPGFVGYTDWRLPSISEWQTILSGSLVTFSSPEVDPLDPAMGTNPSGAPQVQYPGQMPFNADFVAVAPFVSNGLWHWTSASRSGGGGIEAWGFWWGDPPSFLYSGKTTPAYVRAVRTGSCAAPPTPRFEACSDGLTVADTATGLLWERKTNDGSVHDMGNTYTWSSTGTAADGTAYTVFLASLNAASGFAGHTNWRLPSISELQSILVGSGVVYSSADVSPADSAMGTNPTGQSGTCASAPCIDPDFTAVGGPTTSSFYWSSSSFESDPTWAWDVGFHSGIILEFNSPKSGADFVRAVRAGSWTE